MADQGYYNNMYAMYQNPFGYLGRRAGEYAAQRFNNRYPEVRGAWNQYKAAKKGGYTSYLTSGGPPRRHASRSLTGPLPQTGAQDEWFINRRRVASSPWMKSFGKRRRYGKKKFQKKVFKKRSKAKRSR